jgi:hypothetical protein
MNALGLGVEQHDGKAHAMLSTLGKGTDGALAVRAKHQYTGIP